MEGGGLELGRHARTGGSARRLGALAVSLAALALPASASGAVINFDDQSAPSPGGGRGTIVNVQYAGQGVTFGDVEVYNNPTIARSQPNVAETPCFAVEFCHAPITARFTAPQDRVSVWAGYSFTSAPPTVRLTAYDEETGGNAIGSTDAALPGASGPVPAATELALNPPGSRIRRIELTTTSSDTASLAIDDLEFPTVGPPPACNAAGPPEVFLYRPANGATVQTNLFELLGDANPNGAPITSATIELLSPAAKTRAIYPTLIDADGGTFNAMVGQLLEPGKNDLRVTATNCAGTGSAATQVNLEPIPASARFRQLGPIEVNQAVQDATNQTRLIAADGTNFKRTFARVYLGLDGASAIGDVSATLTAFRPDGSRPDGPLLVESLGSAEIRDTNTLESVRANSAAGSPSDLTRSLNFELPREWLAEGRLHLELADLYVEGQRVQLPCDGCANPGPGGAGDLVAFHRVPPVRIWLVSVPYMANATSPVRTPAQNDINMLASWLRRAYPTAEVRNTNMFLGTTLTEPPEERDMNGKVTQEGFTCDDVNSELSDLVSSQQAQHAATRYYGVVDDTDGFMRGCAPIGGRFGSGPTGCCIRAWDTDGVYGDWYGGHEIGHMYGRKHPGQCDESSNDDAYPYDPDGLIGNADFDYQGLDAGNTTLSLPMRLYDWRDGWTDVMTYCDNQWISNYTYNGILKNLCNHPVDRVNCPDRGEIAARSQLRAKRKRGPGLTVSGEVDLASGRVELGTLATGRGLTLTQRPKRSVYEIVLRRRGRDRAYPFEPKELADLPAGQERAQFNEVVRFDPATREIAIEKGGRELASERVSRHAPGVRITSLKRKKGKAKVRWRSRDNDGGRRTHSVLYSPDGKEYLPLAAGLRGKSHTVDLRRLPGGRKARIRVVANDGVLTGAATSGRFRAPVKAPEVTILAPQPGAAYRSDDLVQLAASVEDLQDDEIPAKRIVWRSDLQGELGTGPQIETRLDPGSHEITATATNSGKRSGSASIRVEVAAVPPFFDAS